jgi:hypothetical protein
MNERKLQEIKTSLENGVLVSRPTWVEVVDHALALTDQRTSMARLIVEKLAPRYVTDSNGPDAWACQCCTAEAKGGPDEAPGLIHDRDCEYVSALWVYEAAIAQNSGAKAFLVSEGASLLAKDRWDSNSVEARFHKSIKFLTKREQGYVMEAFRNAILSTRGDAA